MINAKPPAGGFLLTMDRYPRNYIACSKKKFLPIGCDIGQEFDIQLFEGKVNGKAQLRAGNVSIHGILALQNQP